MNPIQGEMEREELGAGVARLGAAHESAARYLMPVACCAFALYLLAAILTSRCLYADGAHEFVRVMQSQTFVSLMWSRHFAFYIYQAPLVLAIKAGITDLRLLRLAFGLGCFLPWPAALVVCHWIAPKHFWIVVAACAAGYLNTAFMAVEEHILAHALFWPALFVILFARPLKPLAAVVLLASATGLLFIYESELFVGIVLGVLSVRRMIEDSGGIAATPGLNVESHYVSPLSQGVWFLAACLFFAGSGIALRALLKPELPVNFAGFRETSIGLLLHLGWTATWTIIWAFVMLGVWMSPRAWTFIARPVCVAVLAVALVIWAAWPILMPDQLDTARQYDNRAADALMPLLMLPVALIAAYRPDWLEGRRARLTQMSAVLLCVQSVWQLGATWQWHKDVVQLQSIVSDRAGPIPLSSTTLKRGAIESRRGDFDWTWPCLSIALSPTRHIQGMVCADGYLDTRLHPWQPFQPLTAESLPDLSHYGIDFLPYLSALARWPGFETVPVVPIRN